MTPDTVHKLLEEAEPLLASARSGLLIVAQGGGGTTEIAEAARCLRDLKQSAKQLGESVLVSRIDACEAALDGLFTTRTPLGDTAYSVLDLIAGVEAELLDIPLRTGDLASEMEQLLDSSFGGLDNKSEPEPPAPAPEEQFELDEETLDIFRSEAEGLLANISAHLSELSSSPGDQTALWEIRRNAHTFKGSAGIVGLAEASRLAHRMEDLLDRMVELRSETPAAVIELLGTAARQMGAIVGLESSGEAHADLGPEFDAVLKAIDSGTYETIGERAFAANGHGQRRPTEPKTPKRPNPIVRVSLDRLDELIRLSGELAEYHRTILSLMSGEDGSAPQDIGTVTAAAAKLGFELGTRLRGVRMQRFGTIETRLNRAVHVTCQEESKRAALKLLNGDIEVDTLLIDDLVEPLIHLLKNAVVHGIEPPETRRLIGKPEKGTVQVRIEQSPDGVRLIVNDDGRGLSPDRIKAKALADGAITAEQAASMSDKSALELIFNKGLTTAESLSLNAGRGIGMSIVKQSIERLGGSIRIRSTPNRGTEFILKIPVKGEVSETAVVSRAKPLVLLVDDSATVRRASSKLFDKAGFRTIDASNGAEAIELLYSGKWHPDLIVSDVEMPVMDGWEFVETAKASETFAAVPVVLVTSLSGDDLRLRAFELGCADFIQKPLDTAKVSRICSYLTA